MKPHPFLTKQDLAMFARHKIPAELVAEAAIARTTSPDARSKWYLSAPSKINLAGIVYPHFDRETGDRMTFRVRRDKPEMVDGKPKNKYMSPAGGPRILYCPPGAAAKLQDKDTSICAGRSREVRTRSHGLGG